MDQHDIKDLRDRIKELKAEMVTQAEFKAVRAVVYGLVASVLLAVLGALLANVLK